MIIDMLAHIGVKKGEDYKVESLLEIMDRSGVDKCMICSQLETVNNEYIDECCRKYPERTLGFAVINPWDIDGEEQLEKCFKEYHFYGLKLNAIRFGYSADRHSVLDPYFDLCRKYKKCVVAHGQSDMFSIPDKWAEMAKSYPDVPVVLYHIGVPMMYERACELARDIPNFYVSTCGSYVPVIKMAYEIAGPEKVLYSSDAPFGDEIQEIEKIRYICQNPEHLEMMLGGNAEKMLGL
ncbi:MULTISPECIES: amidohydrolase family protein [Lachnospiraceae]|jgi:predicted TIM-barrel fold metal-dependent hydrolase|uniref:Amidohydrolase family protein n=1 Tax=Faecalicatena acetigenes TaxID=2981790 RepID=A0ABT2TC56_9FIRM|nr:MULTISPECIES: amidohydrolase family protein [Lachnospiraceae]MCU6747401.1 amidohydrolase family protein [Faecalicatena acetigenes]RGT73379.1 amidohydrolase [Ruminococcus sp. AF18-22]SCH85705.1 Predicted metal-dependent hydrolase of the TIM-barrel fold [uncultured Clostridium sp.]